MGENEHMSLPLKILLCLALALGGTVYGFYANKHRWWIADRIHETEVAFNEVFASVGDPWYLLFPRTGTPIETFDAAALQPGLVLVAGIGGDRKHFVNVIERDGTVVHSWSPNWFDIWPETPEGVPAGRIPQQEPGAILHGVEIEDNGDLILNYEFLSTVRLSACGERVWALPNLGHHSVHLAEDDTIWVGSERFVLSGATGYANHVAPLNSWAISQLDQDGNEIRRKEILEILLENDLAGLMHLSTLMNTSTVVTFDTLHPNDVETFPSDWASDIFAPGDLLISLRNINTVMVVDPQTWKIKFRSTGTVLRQHDADFMPGDKIIVYDNHNMNPIPREELSSRVVEIDARTGSHRVYFEGEGETRYYSATMGRQQPLPNGNLMVISPHEGRAMEVDPVSGDLLWQYYNVISDENNGLVTETHVLPPAMNRGFFENLRANCENV